jgi:hypothetical protein
MREESTAILHFPGVLPGGAQDVTFTIVPKTGVGPSGPATVPLQGQ